MSNKPAKPASNNTSGSEKKQPPAPPSASRQADKAAKKGEPLPAKNQGERSPKQENL